VIKALKGANLRLIYNEFLAYSGLRPISVLTVETKAIKSSSCLKSKLISQLILLFNQ